MSPERNWRSQDAGLLMKMPLCLPRRWKWHQRILTCRWKCDYAINQFWSQLSFGCRGWLTPEKAGWCWRRLVDAGEGWLMPEKTSWHQRGPLYAWLCPGADAFSIVILLLFFPSFFSLSLSFSLCVSFSLAFFFFSLHMTLNISTSFFFAPSQALKRELWRFILLLFLAGRIWFWSDVSYRAAVFNFRQIGSRSPRQCLTVQPDICFVFSSTCFDGVHLNCLTFSLSPATLPERLRKGQSLGRSSPL